MTRIEEIKERLNGNAYHYGGEQLAADDVAYLLSVLDRPQEFWGLYDEFQDKIAEKLILKDKLEQALMVLSYIAEEEQVGDAKLIHPPKETAQIALEQLRE